MPSVLRWSLYKFCARLTGGDMFLGGCGGVLREAHRLDLMAWSLSIRVKFAEVWCRVMSIMTMPRDCGRTSLHLQVSFCDYGSSTIYT